MSDHWDGHAACDGDSTHTGPGARVKQLASIERREGVGKQAVSAAGGSVTTRAGSKSTSCGLRVRDFCHSHEPIDRVRACSCSDNFSIALRRQRVASISTELSENFGIHSTQAACLAMTGAARHGATGMDPGHMRRSGDMSSTWMHSGANPGTSTGHTSMNTGHTMPEGPCCPRMEVVHGCAWEPMLSGETMEVGAVVSNTWETTGPGEMMGVEAVVGNMRETTVPGKAMELVTGKDRAPGEMARMEMAVMVMTASIMVAIGECGTEA